MSKVIWPKPERSYASRSRHRFVVQGAEVGRSPWSDLESFRFGWAAILWAMLSPLWRSGQVQIVDQRPSPQAVGPAGE